MDVEEGEGEEGKNPEMNVEEGEGEGGEGNNPVNIRMDCEFDPNLNTPHGAEFPGIRPKDLELELDEEMGGTGTGILQKEAEQILQPDRQIDRRLERTYNTGTADQGEDRGYLKFKNPYVTLAHDQLSEYRELYESENEAYWPGPSGARPVQLESSRALEYQEPGETDWPALEAPAPNESPRALEYQTEERVEESKETRLALDYQPRLEEEQIFPTQQDGAIGDSAGAIQDKSMNLEKYIEGEGGRKRKIHGKGKVKTFMKKIQRVIDQELRGKKRDNENNVKFPRFIDRIDRKEGGAEGNGPLEKFQRDETRGAEGDELQE